MRVRRANQMIARATGIPARMSSATPGGYAPGRMARAGFSLVEMFVVIAIILIIVALAVPGVNAMVYSSNRALAENSLRVGINAARDAAIASSRSGDGAAVFLFDPNGQVRIVPAEVVGQIADPVKTGVSSVGGGSIGAPSSNRSQPTVVRDVLAPIAIGQSVTLPEHWMVRGYAPPGSMLNSSAVVRGTSNSGDVHQWYRTRNYSDSPAAVDEGNWVFPESGLYDIDEPLAANADIRRHSFMVRFSARTGSVSRVDREALLIDPRPSTEMRDDLAMSRTDAANAWKRVDWADDTRKWGVRTLGRGQIEPFEAEVLSNNSYDTVLVKSVNRLALYDERRLARGIGGRLNSDTGTVYETFGANQRISFDQTLFGGATADQIRRNINAWIEGDTSGGPGGPAGDIFDGVIDENDTPESAMFTLQGYTGELTEIEQ